MQLMQIVGLAILVVVMAVVIRAQRPEMALQLSIAAGVFILLMVFDQFAGTVAEIQTIAQRFGLGREHLSVVLKVIGMAYLAEFAVQTCKDAGETALSAKVELAGKVLIVASALPVVVSLLNTIAGILPGGMR